MEKSLQIQNGTDMEFPIKQLHQEDEEPLVFLGKVGLGISKKHLIENKVFLYDGNFLIRDQEDVYNGKTILIPKSLSVRILFKRNCSYRL